MKSSQFTIKHELLFCLLIVIAITSIYAQVISHEFVLFDDLLYVVENSYVQQGITTEGFKWAFNFQNKEETYWHPLTWLSHMVDVTMFGNQSGFHHLVNIIWHMLNTSLLFLLLHRTTRMFWLSALTASFFAVHPLNVETVAWISERKNLLSTFLGLLSIATYVFYTRSPSFIKYVLLVIIYVAGLMAKPMLVTLPFLLLLLDYWPLKRISLNLINTEKKQSFSMRNVNRLVLRFLEKVPLICIALLVTNFVTESLNENNNVLAFSAIPLYLRVENLLVSYVLYLEKLIWPFGLAVFYPFPKSLPVAQVAVCTLLLGCITLAILGPLRRKKHFTVGWLWFLGTLIPVSGLIQAGLWPAMADRWTYFPFIGLFIILAWSIQEFLGRQRYGHTWSIFVIILIIFVLGTISWRQVQTWKNSSTLFNHALAVTENNFLAHNNLGILMVNEGHIQEGIQQFAKSVTIDETYYLARYNLGLNLVRQGYIEQGIEHLKSVILVDPTHYNAHNNLGIAYGRQGNFQLAIKHFSEVLRLDPNNQQARYNLNMVNNHLMNNSSRIQKNKPE